MNSAERPDLLLDETVNEITGVFEVDHVFPEVFKEEERHERLGLWARIKTFFGLRGRAKKAVPDEPGASDQGGE